MTENVSMAESAITQLETAVAKDYFLANAAKNTVRFFKFLCYKIL